MCRPRLLDDAKCCVVGVLMCAPYQQVPPLDACGHAVGDHPVTTLALRWAPVSGGAAGPRLAVAWASPGAGCCGASSRAASGAHVSACWRCARVSLPAMCSGAGRTISAKCGSTSSTTPTAEWSLSRPGRSHRRAPGGPHPPDTAPAPGRSTRRLGMARPHLTGCLERCPQSRLRPGRVGSRRVLDPRSTPNG